MKTLGYAACFTVACFLSSGCAYQYIPTQHYLTIHRQKGEVAGGVHVMPLGLNAGYSFTNHLYAFSTGHLSTRHDQNKFPDLITFHKSKSSELNIGGGYYLQKNEFHFHVSAGGGFGKTQLKKTVDERNGVDSYYGMKASTSNLFIEPVVAFVPNEHSEIGIFARLRSVHYYHITSDMSIAPYPDYEFFNGTSANLMLLEPGVFFSAGSREFKGHWQVGHTHDLNSHSHAYRLHAENFYVRAGITVLIPTGQRGQKNKSSE